MSPAAAPGMPARRAAYAPSALGLGALPKGGGQGGWPPGLFFVFTQESSKCECCFTVHGAQHHEDLPAL
jgi:hypothetical protein